MGVSCPIGIAPYELRYSIHACLAQYTNNLAVYLYALLTLLTLTVHIQAIHIHA